MVNKDDFDKLDTDKDGVISEDEFEKGKDILSEEKGIEKEKLNWFLRLITLGDRFSFKDLIDRAKESFVQFIVVFFGVLISFGVEQKGDDFEDREWNIENLYNLLDEMNVLKAYTEEHLMTIEYIRGEYKDLLENWESEKKSLFIWVYGPKDYGYPLKEYTNRMPFNPDRRVYETIKLDGTFRFLGTEVAKAVYDAYDGNLYQYIKINADKEEEIFTKKFNDRVDSKWIYDLDVIDFDDPQFWIKNKNYIQNDYFVKYNIFKRIELWDQTIGQIKEYLDLVNKSIDILQKEIEQKESEFTIIYWVF